jgi:nitrite reductase/ring-hydroxylating ferredoxin subunit
MTETPTPDANSPATLAGTRLFALDAIPNGGAREAFVGPLDDPLHIVVFRQGDTAIAYRNRCPHFLLPLNAGPGRFILLKDGLVMCAWHSAVFRIADGAGIDGPCMGGSLDPVSLVLEGGVLYLG